MAVNISAPQLLAPGFVAIVESALSLTNTEAQDLCLEVTDIAFVQDADRALAVISQLKELGILLALDGFEYSSLGHLMDIPFDVVKINETFMANLTDSKSSRAVVAKTIELAHLLGLVVVCEGVETAAQYNEVTALAGDSSQGFYISRPMSADTVDNLVGTLASPWVIE